MHSLHFWYKVTRPIQSLTGAIATWLIALLAGSTSWFAAAPAAGAGIIFLNILGASIFHYGAAKRMYARKKWDLIEVDNPVALTTLGFSVMALSNALAYAYLPMISFWITIFNTVAIVGYARWLAKHWSTKNLTIAVVCTTPVLVGWISGYNFHPAIPGLALTIFFGFLGREIFKDCQDVAANHGIRVTLPIWLGLRGAVRIARGCIALSLLGLVPFMIVAIQLPVQMSRASASLQPLLYLAGILLLISAYLYITGRAFRQTAGQDAATIQAFPTLVWQTQGILMACTLLLKFVQR